MTTVQLLRAAADALDDHRDPFAESFLTEHGVTPDEFMNLAEQLAAGARIVAAGIERPRSPTGMIVLRAMVEQTMAEQA